MKNFALISHSAYKRIEDVLFAQVDMRLKETSYRKLDIEKFLTTTLETLNLVIQMLLPVYGKKTWKSVFEHFVQSYVLKVLDGCNEYKPKKEEADMLVDKLQKDRTFIKDVFERNVSPKDLHEGMTAIRLFERALLEPKNELAQILLSLAQKLKDKYNENYMVAVKCLYRNGFRSTRQISVPRRGRNSQDSSRVIRCSTPKGRRIWPWCSINRS